MANRPETGRTYNRPDQLWMVLFLVFCVSAMNGYEVFHRVVHGQEHILSHSAEAEKDPCHRKLRHQDQQHGCAHQSHSLLQEKCSLCDIAHPSSTIALQVLVLGDAAVPETAYTGVSIFEFRYDRAVLSLRAPPVA